MTPQPDHFRTALEQIRDARPPEGGLTAGVDTLSAFAERLQTRAGAALRGTVRDRQNGDGLSFPQPPVSKLHRQAASMFLCWPMNVLDLCKEDKDLPAAIEKLAAFIAVWEAKGATRDAAEGAEETYGEALAKLNNRFAFQPHAAAPTRDAAEGADFPVCKDFLPNFWPADCPKRAAPPDAMRKALRNLVAWVKSIEQPLAECHFTEAISCPRAQIAKAEAALAARVAQVWGSHIWMAWCEDKGFEPDAIWKKEPSDIVKRMEAKAGWQIVCVEIRKFPTIAAKPDYNDPPTKWLVDSLRQLARDLLADPKTPWIGERDPKQHICWTAADRLANSPVRGDREALRKKIGAYFDSIRLGSTNEGATNSLMRYLDTLSLPFQPGEGEREAAIKFCVTVVEEECVLDDAPDNGSECERVLHAVGLAIRDRLNCAIRNPDARQAPHSSDGEGR